LLGRIDMTRCGSWAAALHCPKNRKRPLGNLRKLEGTRQQK
jgi:hypothetical protein